MYRRLDNNRIFLNDMTNKHQSLMPGTRSVRGANTNTKPKSGIDPLDMKTRRIWMGITDPESPYYPYCTLDGDTVAVLNVWQSLLVSTPFAMIGVSQLCYYGKCPSSP